ncbi:MAG TPA: TIGR03943 family protein [Actinophytocola sp.]|uniref:TIGR03943 family putative permease subunit n=1 Tax=Actinophytocola sp. TaxID=1872138 RepID=UPI002DDCFA9D|nr:TIGR03943 family protein [Actinophytocola sp.]HEV2783009.1 TIGR03943 family protein [Actinophytocola sp.]
MRRETQNILLVLLGGALLKISFTGTYLRYVKPSHQWLLITAGAIMVLLALLSIGRDLINNRQAAAVDGHEGHTHSSTGAWLLLLPVLAVFLVAPPALGADSVTRAATTNRAVDDGRAVFPPLPAGDVIALPLSDFSARAAWDEGNSLNDRSIKLTGFVVHDGSAAYIARLAIGCCAADAFPIKVRLDDNPDATALPDDTWIEAVVSLKPGTATRENDYVPAAAALELREIPQPEDPYEH